MTDESEQWEREVDEFVDEQKRLVRHATLERVREGVERLPVPTRTAQHEWPHVGGDSTFEVTFDPAAYRAAVLALLDELDHA